MTKQIKWKMFSGSEAFLVNCITFDSTVNIYLSIPVSPPSRLPSLSLPSTPQGLSGKDGETGPSGPGGPSVRISISPIALRPASAVILSSPFFFIYTEKKPSVSPLPRPPRRRELCLWTLWGGVTETQTCSSFWRLCFSALHFLKNVFNVTCKITKWSVFGVLISETHKRHM